MTGRAWQRRPYGWLADDAAAFLERGARMTDGGTAWLVWYRIGSEEVTVDEYGAYQTANGRPARDLAEITGQEGDSDRPGWYAHRNDAGSLAEAKGCADRVLAGPDETGV